MIEPPFLAAIRTSYDTVAEDFAKRYEGVLETLPLTRAMLAAYAELVLTGGRGPVADLGCGPGHITAHLHGLGVPVFGIDLSPGMVRAARRTYPGLRFDVGTMTGLDLEDGSLGGIIAMSSTYHIPPEHLPTVFDEFDRTLAPGGHVLLGIHIGDEHLRPERGYGHPVSYESYLLPAERIADLLARAGLTVTAQLREEPGERTRRPHACLLAHKPDLS